MLEYEKRLWFVNHSSSSTWEIYSKKKDPFEDERFGLITKILKLKEEIRRLRKDAASGRYNLGS